MALKYVNYLGESIKVDTSSPTSPPEKSSRQSKATRGLSQGVRSFGSGDYTGEEPEFELDSIEVIDKDTGYLFFSIAGYQLRLLYVLLQRLDKTYYKLFPMSTDQFPPGSNLLVDFEKEANRLSEDLDWLRTEIERESEKISTPDQAVDLNDQQRARLLSLEYLDKGAPTMLFSIHGAVIKAKSEFFSIYGSVEPLPVDVTDFGGLSSNQQDTVLSLIMQLTLDAIRFKFQHSSS